MKDYIVKFKKICENSVRISADSEEDLSIKIKDLYNSDLKNTIDGNATHIYYQIDINDEVVMKRDLEVK